MQIHCKVAIACKFSFLLFVGIRNLTAWWHQQSYKFTSMFPSDLHHHISMSFFVSACCFRKKNYQLHATTNFTNPLEGCNCRQLLMSSFWLPQISYKFTHHNSLSLFVATCKCKILLANSRFGPLVHQKLKSITFNQRILQIHCKVAITCKFSFLLFDCISNLTNSLQFSPHICIIKSHWISLLVHAATEHKLVNCMQREMFSNSLQCCNCKHILLSSFWLDQKSYQFTALQCSHFNFN